MSDQILITGSDGLIGTALRRALPAAGLHVRRFDLRWKGQQVLARDVVRVETRGCAGIVHLAAVSRVLWGEENPQLCWRTNVEGTRNILRAAAESPRKPWVLFASSREVYGHAAVLPATEDSPLRPCNIYGRSKAKAEQLCLEARAVGVRTAIVRLSNVYGSTADHPDRVVPCFARRSAYGQPLRVDGSGNIFDFTHVDDTARGILEIIRCLRAGETLPPIHLLTGRPISLGELAQLASRAGGKQSEIVEAPARSFDVARFYGSPERAGKLLGWSPQIHIADGLGQLVRDFAGLAVPGVWTTADRSPEGAILP